MTGIDFYAAKPCTLQQDVKRITHEQLLDHGQEVLSAYQLWKHDSRFSDLMHIKNTDSEPQNSTAVQEEAQNNAYTNIDAKWIDLALGSKQQIKLLEDLRREIEHMQNQIGEKKGQSDTAADSRACSSLQRMQKLVSELYQLGDYMHNAIQTLFASKNKEATEIETLETVVLDEPESGNRTSESHLDDSLEVSDRVESSSTDLYTRKLETRIEELESLLESLQSSLEHLSEEHYQTQKRFEQNQSLIKQLNRARDPHAARWNLLQRAYFIKSSQLDKLCQSVNVPFEWESWSGEDGIRYYRRKDTGEGTDLKDPRVPFLLKRLNAPLSTKSVDGRMEGNHKSSREFESCNSNKSPAIHSQRNITMDQLGPPLHTQPVSDFITPLPKGWEMRATTTGAIYFIHPATETSTWADPRHSHGKTHKPIRSLVFDVVFSEPGPIGIHFQANDPDEGATVRKIIPSLAADSIGTIRSSDRLIAVNKCSVRAAPFRHIMLLLQGGLRPLTLTFEQDAKHFGRAGNRTNGVHQRSLSAEAYSHVHDLDEEIVMDTLIDEVEMSHTHEENYSLADKIITNVFSMFWSPPDQAQVLSQDTAQII